jgi:hypothetical protein
MLIFDDQYLGMTDDEMYYYFENIGHAGHRSLKGPCLFHAPDH